MATKQLVQTTVSVEDMNALREHAEKEGTTVAAVLRNLVRRWADERRSVSNIEPRTPKKTATQVTRQMRT